MHHHHQQQAHHMTTSAVIHNTKARIIVASSTHISARLMSTLMSFVCALMHITPIALHRWCRHRRRFTHHAYGQPSTLHTVVAPTFHHNDQNSSTALGSSPSVTLSSSSLSSWSSFLTSRNDDGDNVDFGCDVGGGIIYDYYDDDHLAPSAGNNLHIYATHPFDDSRDYRRLLVQLEETERRFDDFWNSHLTRLRQCLELRLFEQAFRELQVCNTIPGCSECFGMHIQNTV